MIKVTDMTRKATFIKATGDFETNILNLNLMIIELKRKKINKV